MACRGELISKINGFNITIHGGDLSHGKIENPLMRINKENVKYLPATPDYKNTDVIYRNSKININLSSLQFDTAINNRIIDIVMAGGFVITDKRSGLLELCPSCAEISFDSPEEMLYLIDFYMHHSNSQKYYQVKEAIFLEMKDQFTYENVISDMLKKLIPLGN
jgi:spore maturation protein CgeB